MNLSNQPAPSHDESLDTSSKGDPTDSILAGFRNRTRFLECFTGRKEQDARRWLQRLDRENRRADGAPISASEWLDKFNINLDGEAAEWADNDRQVSYILSDAGIRYATDTQVHQVKEAFLRRWGKLEVEESEQSSNPVADILALRQGMEESHGAYYQRALLLLYKAGGSDTASRGWDTLQGLLISQYVKGLHDGEIKVAMLRYPYAPQATLAGAYNQVMVEEKVAKAKKEMEEQARQQEELRELREITRFAPTSYAPTILPVQPRQVLQHEISEQSHIRSFGTYDVQSQGQEGHPAERYDNTLVPHNRVLLGPQSGTALADQPPTKPNISNFDLMAQELANTPAITYKAKEAYSFRGYF